MLNIVVFKWKPLADQKEFIPTQIGDSKVDYDSNKVAIHHAMVKRNLNIPFKYHLFTDEIDSSLNSEISQHELWTTYRELGGCFHRLFTFSKEFGDLIGGRFICMDLDMVIVDDISKLLDRKEEFVYYRMRNADGKGWRMNNGMYMMEPGSRKEIWETFSKNPSRVMANRVGPGTDQGVTNSLLNLKKEANWSQRRGIYDMRLDFLVTGKKDLPHDAKIVMFPGPRDPENNNLKAHFKWIESNYCV